MKEQLRKMYNAGVIGVDELLRATQRLSISLDDILDIVGEESALELIRAAKTAEISQACNTTIVSGIDLDLADSPVHFNLSIEDQSNINSLFRLIELGGTEFPYQADGDTCRIYTANEIIQIYIAAQTHITIQTTYHNALKAYVASLQTAEEISAVTYGMELPKQYQDEIDEKLSVAQEQLNAIVSRLDGNE